MLMWFFKKFKNLYFKAKKKALIYRPKTAKDKDMWVVLLTYSRIGFAKTRFCIALLFAALKEKTRR